MKKTFVLNGKHYLMSEEGNQIVTTLLHGVQPRFGKGRSLKVLSYAVFVNGVQTVSHDTTREFRKMGMSVWHLMNLEKQHDPSLVTLPGK